MRDKNSTGFFHSESVIHERPNWSLCSRCISVISRDALGCSCGNATNMQLPAGDTQFSAPWQWQGPQRKRRQAQAPAFTGSFDPMQGQAWGSTSFVPLDHGYWSNSQLAPGLPSELIQDIPTPCNQALMSTGIDGQYGSYPSNQLPGDDLKPSAERYYWDTISQLRVQDAAVHSDLSDTQSPDELVPTGSAMVSYDGSASLDQSWFPVPTTAYANGDSDTVPHVSDLEQVPANIMVRAPEESVVVDVPAVSGRTVLGNYNIQAHAATLQAHPPAALESDLSNSADSENSGVSSTPPEQNLTNDLSSNNGGLTTQEVVLHHEGSEAYSSMFPVRSNAYSRTPSTQDRLLSNSDLFDFDVSAVVAYSQASDQSSSSASESEVSQESTEYSQQMEALPNDRVSHHTSSNTSTMSSSGTNKEEVGKDLSNAGEATPPLVQPLTFVLETGHLSPNPKKQKRKYRRRKLDARYAALNKGTSSNTATDGGPRASPSSSSTLTCYFDDCHAQIPEDIEQAYWHFRQHLRVRIPETGFRICPEPSCNHIERNNAWRIADHICVDHFGKKFACLFGCQAEFSRTDLRNKHRRDKCLACVFCKAVPKGVETLEERKEHEKICDKSPKAEMGAYSQQDLQYEGLNGAEEGKRKRDEDESTEAEPEGSNGKKWKQNTE